MNNEYLISSSKISNISASLACYILCVYELIPTRKLMTNSISLISVQPEPQLDTETEDKCKIVELKDFLHRRIQAEEGLREI